MWDQDGMWRPQDYSLHNLYDQISNRPTEEQKVQYIDNLFNTILERAHSRANFSDLRSELVDHYISELGPDFDVTDGKHFQKKVLDYHKSFGGAYRVKQIADNFYKTKHRLIRRQFGKWFLEFWPMHFLYIITGYWLYLSLDIASLLISFVVMVTSICAYEGYKYIQERGIRKQIKTGESSIVFFYQFKLELFSLLWLPLHFYNISAYSELYWLNYIFTLAGLYFIPWLYYYHSYICQKRITPLLEHYKAQMI